MILNNEKIFKNYVYYIPNNNDNKLLKINYNKTRNKNIKYVVYEYINKNVYVRKYNDDSGIIIF